jgi:hypothetical protein
MLGWDRLGSVKLVEVLRCGGLDIVQGLVKTVDIFGKSISGGKADFKFQIARCKEHMRKLCVFRDGIYLSRLFNFSACL